MAPLSNTPSPPTDAMVICRHHRTAVECRVVVLKSPNVAANVDARKEEEGTREVRIGRGGAGTRRKCRLDPSKFDGAIVALGANIAKCVIK